MNFLVREVKEGDLGDLYDLSRQFSLLNLPPDKKVISEKIDNSLAAFSGKVSKEQAAYMFVLEDKESGMVIGSSQIKAQKGTKEVPNYSFKLLKKERFSKDLGVGFIHQILRLNLDRNGPTELGGLVLSKAYRRRPEKVGKLISLSRFLYIGLCPEKFSEQLLAEMAPPLTDEGRSEFWEALGRRFTGMPYQEADALSYQNKEFISDLFPEEDIYLCLLDSKARLVLGRVSDETQPALHLLQSIGFEDKNEVDPFDGGPHIGSRTSDITLIKNGGLVELTQKDGLEFEHQFMIGADVANGYRGGQTAGLLKGNQLFVPLKTIETLGVESGTQVFQTSL